MFHAFTTVIPLEEGDQEEDFFLNLLSNVLYTKYTRVLVLLTSIKGILNTIYWALVIPLEEDDQEEDFFLNLLSNIFDIRFGKASEKLRKSWLCTCISWMFCRVVNAFPYMTSTRAYQDYLYEGIPSRKCNET